MVACLAAIAAAMMAHLPAIAATMVACLAAVDASMVACLAVVGAAMRADMTAMRRPAMSHLVMLGPAMLDPVRRVGAIAAMVDVRAIAGPVVPAGTVAGAVFVAGAESKPDGQYEQERFEDLGGAQYRHASSAVLYTLP